MKIRLLIGIFAACAMAGASAQDYAREKRWADEVLLSHSMGAWMVNEYLDRQHATSPYKAWVVMGFTGGFSWEMRRYALPILDIHGDQDVAPVLGAAGRRKFALQQSNGSRQVVIAGADHHYNGREAELSAAIDAFLAGLK